MSGSGMETPAEAACPLCGAAGARLRYPGNPLPVRQCACGMVFLSPQPSPEQLREIYGSDYYLSLGISGQDDEAVRGMKKETFRRQFEAIAAGAKPGRVLDVGCASGFFMEAATEAGWEAYGVELSGFAAELARSRFGDRVRHGTLEEAGYPDAFFDVVTLFDLLEHVPDPRSFLAEVRRVLRPGGRLLLVLPNAASLSARLMGRHWSHYNAEHLHYFTPETVAVLLCACGFEVEGVASAPKCLNLAYIFNQFRRYPSALVTPLRVIAERLLPNRMKSRNLRLHCGEMLVTARSGAAPHPPDLH